MSTKNSGMDFYLTHQFTCDMVIDKKWLNFLIIISTKQIDSDVLHVPSKPVMDFYTYIQTYIILYHLRCWYTR